MEILEIKKTQKKSIKYTCNNCDFVSCNKTDYIRHLSTLKHKKTFLEINGNEKNAYFSCNNCYKIYKTKSGLWKHNKLCNNKDHKDIIIKNNTNFEKFTEIVISQQEQIKDFHETLKYMMTSHEKREEVFLELAKKPSIFGNNNNINSNNNINYHVYLNEHCANAIDFPDFLNNLSISMEDLFYSKDNGYPKAISNIFQRNLSILDKTERPIYCSDKKRMNFYVKDGKWEKDKDNIKILESIWKVTHKQIKYMDEWRKANPNWRENEEKDLEFMNIVRNIMGGSTDEEQFKNKNKIMKELAMNNDIKELFSD
uniref:C2H2-type domain-containing protein n=1 Tax=viral metagenome TaxID=1070528 RepID=A0A6C0KIR9_9ZZZZ